MQQGGSQYGVPPPEVAVFSGAGTGTGTRAQVLGIPGSEHLQQQQQQQQAEAASPISSRPPAPRGSSFDELAPAVPSGGGHADEDAMAAAGEEAERGAVPGNRWPRQETVALLKIRSDMDATFRDATLKGPLWEEVSRKLAELGYRRSAKKCKEKFENVHKYYKRTKDGRAGRQDGKNYRFFPQLEALHGGSGSSTPTHTTVAAAITTTAPPLVVQPSSAGMMGSAARLQPTPLSTIPPPPPMTGTSAGVAAAAGPSVGINFSSGSSSSSASDSEEEDTEEGLPGESRKRKRRSGGGSRRMMAFFEGLMRQVMERQEVMQQRFLETIEKREQDRMIREEAWKRQEVARLHREQEALAQERAVSASRDAAIIAFLQKVTGQTVPVPPPATVSPSPPPSAPQPPPRQHQPSPAQATTTPAPPPQLPQPAQPAQPPPPQPQTKQQAHHQFSPLEVGPVTELAPEVVGTSGASTSDPASSRWPKVEVHALIKLRSGLESRYQDSGPKGPLWEDIAAGMLGMGYSRSAKRCKEKWENINKYYKKVKESNKKRTEDSKTCPYFHELDALYRKKNLGSQPREEQMQDAAAGHLPLPAETRNTTDGSSGNKGGHHDGSGGSTLQVQATNGGFSATFFGEQAGSGVPLKKPEDIVKELMDQQHQQGSMDAYKGLEEHDDSDNMDQEYDDDDDDDDEHSKLAYKIQYQQRPSDATNAGAAAAAAATGSFMAMVQ